MPRRGRRSTFLRPRLVAAVFAAAAVGCAAQDASDSQVTLGEHQCSGHDMDWGDCAPQEPCVECEPMDCEFSDWGAWYEAGGCVGLKFRHRTVKTANNECGEPCSGATIDSQPSLKDECVDVERDCLFSPWTAWTKCESVMDQSVRERTVDQVNSKDGLSCIGNLKETRPCGGPEKHDCTFSAWREWTQCSASCGEGRHTRMRSIESQADHGGDTCNDMLLEAAPCATAACPAQDCAMSDWTEWSACDGGFNQRIRSRQVITPPLGEGKACEGRVEETEGCERPQPADCEISDWGEWSQCDKSCKGGQRFRERTLLSPSSNGGTCELLPLKTTEACNTQPCSVTTADCQMTTWTTWSDCSVSIGAGSKSRVRMVEALAQNDGEGCDGPLAEMLPCQVEGEAVRDCEWGDWEEWSACTESCGGGTKTRSREIVQVPENGGQLCEPYEKSEVAACHTEQCDEGCIDGMWGNWMEWSECSATCNQGYKSRRRTIDVQANKCGKPAEGLREEFAVCSELPPCVVNQDCALSDWDEWSHCSCDCFGIRERNRHITTYASGNGTLCNNVHLKVIEPCNPSEEGGELPAECQEEPPVDCEMSPWEEWSKCTVECGGGQMERKRAILRPAKRGGKPCEDAVASTEACNTQPCKPVVCQDCVWGEWSDWGDCTKCGGQRWRHRSIDTLPNHCGTPCALESAKEVSNCTSDCTEDYFCAWSDWSDEHCTSSCGATTTMRNRAMQLLPNEEDVVGHYLFKGTKDSKCSGSMLTVAECPFIQSCNGFKEPVHCEFSDWSDWNQPSCVGLCERQRVIKQMNNELGDPCHGPLLATKRCETDCNMPKDCLLSEWTDWSACDDVVTGQRYRERSVEQKPENGGMACIGHLNETRGCNVIDAVPCEFEEWGEWGACSESCGDGTRLRARKIASLAEGGGTQCFGSLSQIQACHGDGCPPVIVKDCEFLEWSEWSECQSSGQRKRSRQFAEPARGGGEPCIGPLLETETCIKDPVDCAVSDWTAWDDCDRTCGAGQTRREREIHSFPKNGGKLCPHDLIQTKGCDLRPCDVRDCLVSGWGPWSACSKTCGPAMKSRHREVVSLRGEGGAGCFFELGQTADCDDNPSCGPRDCEWEEWQEWSSCSASCDGGTRTRNRDIKIVATDGGKTCQAFDKEQVEPCNLGGCKKDCYDGEWGNWEEWSPCSVSCAGGTSFRKRKIIKMANSCGKEPAGMDRETKFCNADVHCEPPRDCEFDAWEAWSACSASCNGIKRRSRTVAQYGRGDGAYCIGALKETHPCNPSEGEQTPVGCSDGPDVDCLVSEWAGWSVCSASCDGGEHMRMRTIVQHPLNNGKSCDEALSEIRECARQSCGGPQPVDCEYGEWEEWGECTKCSGERKRHRHIIAFPANGGKACDAFDMEEIGQCPRSCHGELYCSWNGWSAWSQCSTSCGTGGKRHRRRNLVLSDRAPEDVPVGDLSDILERYEVLEKRTKELEVQHFQEIAMAFAAGCVALVAFMVGGRAVRERRGQIDPAQRALLLPGTGGPQAFPDESPAPGGVPR